MYDFLAQPECANADELEAAAILLNLEEPVREMLLHPAASGDPEDLTYLSALALREALVPDCAETTREKEKEFLMDRLPGWREAGGLLEAFAEAEARELS